MQNFTDILIKKEICKDEDREIITHGLTSGIELIFNVLTTILLGLMFGLVVESIVFLISFSLIRTYAGGYHCKKVSSCYIMSSATVVILVLALVKCTTAQYIPILNLFVLLVAIPILLRFAPLDMPTKLLDKKEKIYFRKKLYIHLSAECIVIVSLFIVKLCILSYVISLGVILSAILVLIGLIRGGIK